MGGGEHPETAIGRALSRYRVRYSPGLSGLGLVTAAALAWAFIPTLLTQLKDTDLASQIAANTILNLAKCLAAAAIVVSFRSPRMREAVRLVRVVMRDRRLRRMVVLDGILIGASNLLFLLALSQGNAAAATLIMNSWPVVATTLLVRFMPRLRVVGGLQLSQATLALLGVMVIVLAAHTHGDSALSLAYAGGAAIAQGAVVVTHQRFLQAIGAEWEQQPLWQALRGGIATIASLVLLVPVLLVEPPHLQLPAEAMASLTLAGALWAVSGIFFHMGVMRSENPFITIPWMLAPLLSALLASMAQGAPITPDIFIGGAIVLSANAMLMLMIEPSRNVAILMITIVFSACAVLTIRGRGIADYYSIVQALAAFFAVTYGFLATRLDGHRTAAELMRLRWSKFAELSSMQSSVASSQISMAELASLRADRDGSAHLRLRLFPISESLAVTALGLGSCVIVTYARPSGRASDVIAFLIVSSVLFAVILLWTSFGGHAEQREKSGTIVGSPAEAGEAIYGYFCAMAAYLSITLAILLGAPNWPRL
ncbi:hypothetical protein [Nocardia suismassiliense]|uniref:hypothetical protein n=1 Tax=Nocardia suismassiliense TaxID=2077092 RepID=UPI000D1EDA48|nr:hypothetical protein [Nocardia suismassiliense]